MYKCRTNSVSEKLPKANGIYQIFIQFKDDQNIFRCDWISSTFDIDLGWFINVENKFIGETPYPTLDKIEVTYWNEIYET